MGRANLDVSRDLIFKEAKKDEAKEWVGRRKIVVTALASLARCTHRNSYFSLFVEPDVFSRFTCMFKNKR